MRAPSLLALAAVLSGCASPRGINVTPTGLGTAEAPCMAEINGERVPVDALPAFARQWRGREAHLIADTNTSYRCLFGTIYQLQRAGFGRIGFISEPPPPPPAPTR